jgi:hypothetical protein
MSKWLIFYPPAYRRERGQEILDTFDGSPTLRAGINLLRHGARCRLGRPASRTVVVWAAITSALCGLFVAALATRAAWQTARPLPSVAAAAKMFASVFPGHEMTDQPIRFNQPIGPNHSDWTLSGGAFDYVPGTVILDYITMRAGLDHRQTVATVRERLQAKGWEVATPITREMSSCGMGSACDPATMPLETVAHARHGDDLLKIKIRYHAEIWDRSAHGQRVEMTEIFLELSRATPWTVHTAGAAGGLLGAAVGLLVFGWASRRTESRPVPQALGKILFGTSIFLWAAPMLYAVPHMVIHHVEEYHGQWHPLWEWLLVQPTMLWLFLIGCGSALLTLAIAAIPHRTTTPLREVV